MSVSTEQAMAASVTRLPVAAIRTGERHRRELGDVKGLAESIAARALLHPVVVTPDHTLIAGYRRLEAVKLLGWIDVPVTVIEVEDLLMAERDENMQRKDFTPTEAVAIGRLIEDRHREKIKQLRPEVNRRIATIRHDSTRMSNQHPGVTRIGTTVDAASKAVGMGRWKYDHAKQVVAAAEEDPGTFGDLPAQMDATGNVEGAFTEVSRRKAIKAGIGDIPRHEVHRRTRRPKANDMMEKATQQLEGLALGFAAIDLSQLDLSRCKAWLGSLTASEAKIGPIRRSLKRRV